MPDPQQPSNAFVVEVEGTALPDSVTRNLLSVVVDSDRHAPDLFVLTFRDPHRMVLGQTRLRLASKVRISVVSNADSAPAPLLVGEVTAMELEHDTGGTYTVVRGYDLSHRLHRGRRTKMYRDVSYADVAREVGTAAGLRAGEIEATSPVHRQVSQGNCSDWRFLTALAAEVGFEMTVEEGRLHFKSPTDAGSGPGSARLDSADPLQLALGADLLRLRAGVSAAEQVREVQIRGWDPDRKKALIGTAPARTESAVVATTPVQAADAFGPSTYVGVDIPYRTQSEVDSAAKAAADRIAGGLAELEGVARGNPRLKAGVAVNLGLLGDPFDGRYTLTSVRHRYDADSGYTTSFTVSGARTGSLFGLTGGAAEPSRIPGVVTAQVSDTHDPEDLGRVRITLPWLSDDYVSDWARVVAPGAGRDRGMVILPEVNDEVLVAFEQGDLRRPYVIGGLHNAMDPPMLGDDLIDGTTGAVRRRGFVSKKGHRLVFLDDDGDSGIALLTGDQRFRLALHDTDRRITLHADGKVEITGTQGVTLTSETDLNIEATGALRLKGATVDISASGSVSVAGTPIKLN